MIEDPDEYLHEPIVDFTRWAPILGRWETTEDSARYVGPRDPEEPAIGLLIAPGDLNLLAGVAHVEVMFPDDDEPEPQGRIMVGFSPRGARHYSGGLGGFRALYSVEQFLPNEGYSALVTWGRADALKRDRTYLIRVVLVGQIMHLAVDGVEVAEAALPTPPEGAQVGLIARGRGTVEFMHFDVTAEQREAFIVMKFGEPFDTLYREVIAPICIELGYRPVRADEFSGPGVIIEGIRRASVVIAEITPVNANVFYELGYAHATGKPTILLADREQLPSLPFDISGRRVIFYNDTIGGKPKADDLRRHLGALP